MHEAMVLFKALANCTWFKQTPIILFLNKIDLFKGKLAISPITEYFPDYTGSNIDYDTATKYFADHFLRLNRNPNRPIYMHYTNATDTSLLKTTMESVQDIILRKMLYTFLL
jgi:guanine nucleotide-binding protein subunit alpha